MIDEFEQECRLLYEMGLKDSPLRLEYEEKVRDLSILREQMETEGKTKEQIALTMHERRRELGLSSRKNSRTLTRSSLFIAGAGTAASRRRQRPGARDRRRNRDKN